MNASDFIMHEHVLYAIKPLFYHNEEAILDCVFRVSLNGQQTPIKSHSAKDNYPDNVPFCNRDVHVSWDWCIVWFVQSVYCDNIAKEIGFTLSRGTISTLERLLPWLLIAAFNSLRPSDAIWRHGSGSTLARVMTCCLTASSHHLNQCWLISKV